MRILIIMSSFVLLSGCYREKRIKNDNELIGTYNYLRFCENTMGLDSDYTREKQSIKYLADFDFTIYDSVDTEINYEVIDDRMFIALEVSEYPYYIFTPSALLENDTIKISLNGVINKDQRKTGIRCPHIFKMYLEKPLDDTIIARKYIVVLDQIQKGIRRDQYHPFRFPPDSLLH